MAVGLPLVMAVLDAGLLGRGPRWKEKLPYLLPAAAASVLACWGQASAGAMAAADRFGWPQRLAQAAYAHAFYLVKTLWPTRLAPMYEYALRLDPLESRFLACAALAGVLAITAWSLRRKCPALWTAWLSYLILLAPVLGAVKFGAQLVADRYSYLPCMAWSVLAGALLLKFLNLPNARRLMAAAGGAVLIALSLASRRQLGFWQDSEILYRRILAVDPAQSTARNNLGLVLDAQGRAQEALAQYALALQSRPRYAAAHNNAGALLLKLGHANEAQAHFEAALASDRRNIDALNNLGLVLAGRGRYGEALRLFDEALRLNPGYANAARNRELILRLKKS